VQEGETEDLADFKKQILALMLALHERVERTEAVQEQQDKALQVPTPSALPSQSLRSSSWGDHQRILG